MKRRAVGRPSRRAFAVALGTLPLGLGSARAQTGAVPAAPAPEFLAAMGAFAAGAAIRQGRVAIEIAELVDNGNTVPITVRVDSPMNAADRVVELIILNEKNPQRDVMRARIGAAVAKGEFSTRMRLATSQKIAAMARLADGSVWAQTVDVIVTLAACIEGDG